MGVEYRFVPPFLNVRECSNFPDAWEHFCCKLLNLENGTSQIYVRSPPEQGVDLFHGAAGKAYQCKSVESGKPGDFHAEHVIESYRAAAKHRASIGWREYILCVNVDITGTANAKLKKAIPDIAVLPRSYWLSLCEKYPAAVERNFRQLIDISSRSVRRAMKVAEIEDVFAAYKPPASAAVFKILLYSQGSDAIYELPVHAEMTASKLVQLLTVLFRLPKHADLCTDEVSASLAHYINFNGKWLEPNDTMESTGIGPRSLITYSIEVKWTERSNPSEQRQVQQNEVQLQQMQEAGGQHQDDGQAGLAYQPFYKPRAVYDLENGIKLAFARTASSLKQP